MKKFLFLSRVSLKIIGRFRNFNLACIGQLEQGKSFHRIYIQRKFRGIEPIEQNGNFKDTFDWTTIMNL